MAQMIVSHKYEDLCSDPRQPHENTGMMEYSWSPSAGEVDMGSASIGASWPASLAQLVSSRFSETLSPRVW